MGTGNRRSDARAAIARLGAEARNTGSAGAATASVPIGATAGAGAGATGITAAEGGGRGKIVGATATVVADATGIRATPTPPGPATPAHRHQGRRADGPTTVAAFEAILGVKRTPQDPHPR